MRRLLVLVTISGSALAAGVACSSSEEREPLSASEDSGSMPAEASTTIDTGAPDVVKQRPPFDPNDEPVTCTTAPCAIELVAGESHFCARMSDGTIRCWGDNEMGSLGVADAGLADAGWRATSVADLAGATQLSAGGKTTCAVVADGGVACWGGNGTGQLGTGNADGDPHPAAVAVTLPSSVVRVDVGPVGACALLGNGEPWCWGDNTYQQLARSPEGPIGAPAKAELGALAIARTAAGTFSSFAVTASGELFSWGAVAGIEGSVAGRLSSIGSDPLPLSIGLGPVSSLSISSTTLAPPSYPAPARGIGHACAIVLGEIFCWGDTRVGALGTGVHEPAESPRRALIASDTAWARQVAAAGETTCARLTDGEVECAGDNASGAMGRDPKTTPFSVVFRPVESLGARALRIATASHAVCAIVEDDKVLCWGGNQRNELGQGRNDDDPHPTPVPVAF
jgi:alpha-tubulin suppressor-like RCC1 family protein